MCVNNKFVKEYKQDIKMEEQNFIKPLNKRLKKEPPQVKDSLSKAVGCVGPVAVYYFLSMFLTLGMAYLIGTGQYGAEQSEMFRNHPSETAAIIRIAVVIVATLPLLPGFFKEQPILLQKKEATTTIKSLSYTVAVIALAVTLAFFLNVAITKLGISGTSDTFKKTSDTQLSLPLGLGLLVYGIVNPITEEIVYRGVVYNRFRRFYGLRMALIAAPLLFGLSHGNVVQLLYGFLMGVAICYVYERFGSFIYPVIFHICANSSVYIAMKSEVLKNALSSVAGMVINGVLGLLILMLMCGAMKIKSRINK